ncbi:kinase-like protein, partial [Pisolithus microcarpus]
EIVSTNYFYTRTCIQVILTGQPREQIVIKSSTTAQHKAHEAQDIIKEGRLLASTCHPNIIPLIKQVTEGPKSSLWMPHMPYSVRELLWSELFTPYSMESVASGDTAVIAPQEQEFIVIAKSIMFQILCAVDYLHQTAGIAHRDIKPGNILVSATGCVQFIDFGMSWKQDDDEHTTAGDVWPEQPHDMHYDVTTRYYRAPELLFQPRSYDAFAIDRWSLGAMFAEFFTALRLCIIEDGEIFSGADWDPPSESDADPKPFIFAKSISSTDPDSFWVRDHLFCRWGLLFSIFEIRGTPNDTNWPSYKQIPYADELAPSEQFGAADLTPLLPNLPLSLRRIQVDTETHSPVAEKSPSPLDLIHRFLVYEPSLRLHAQEALRHPWFVAEPGLLLPQDYVASTQLEQPKGITLLTNWESRSLGEIIEEICE